MKKNAPAKSHFHRTWTAVAFSLLIIIIVPFFASAVNGQSVSDGTPVGTQTAMLVSALSNLESRVAELTSAFRSSQQSAYGATSAGSALADGMPECLHACRQALASCLRSAPTARTPSPTTGAPIGLDACRTRANDCINLCRPVPTPVVSCEDRCAVALGGCVLNAGTDAAKLKDCREQNQRCLLAACVRGTSATRVAARVPSQVCRDQCGRDRAICQRAARFDTIELRRCDEIARVCLEQVCLASDIITPSISTGNNATPGQSVTVACENACTSTYTGCTEKAAGNLALQSACDRSYGDCRGQCLVLIGGGM